jgi:alanine racemase
MGHLPHADVPGRNAAARARFAWGVKAAVASGLRPHDRHLAATAATLTDPLTHHTLVRCGAGLVGIDPSGTTGLRGPFTLTAPLVHVREVAPGTAVGYGHTWRAPAWTHLGLVPVGYADGLPRNATGRAEVSVLGHRVPVVGRISMDQVVVDLGRLAVGPGAEVTVLGPGDAGEPTVQDWAGWAGVLPHEVVTGFGARVSRVHRGTA